MLRQVSRMSKLTELLDELCPDGVEYRPLGELLAIRDSERRPVTKSDRVSGPYPYYGANGIQDYVNEYIFDGEFILLGEDGSVLTDDFRPVTTWAAGKIWVNNHAHVLAAKSDEISLRFSYYALTSTDIRQFVSGGSRAKLNQSGLRLIPLPVPPLEVQQEIVRVLDAFTDLEQSLVSELELRKKQFEEYLSEVLQTSNSGWKSATLGDIGSVRMCKRIMKHQTSPVGDVPFFKIGSFGGQPDAYIPRELFEEYRSKYSFPRVGEILISAAGTIGRTVKYDGEAAYFQDSNIVWLENDETEVTNDYLYYWYKVINWTTDSGTIKRLYNKNLLTAGISYPNKAGQEEIVAKLNTFESLIQSIEQESNLRRTQYEFYRDELLSFTPKED